MTLRPMGGWQEISTIFKNYASRRRFSSPACARPCTVQAALMGADICTCPASVIDACFNHPLTDIGLQKFLKDWEKAQTVKV